MTKKTSLTESLGGSVLVDRRKLFSTLGVAAAGVTAASLVPFKSTLASPAKVAFGKATMDRTQTSGDVSLAFPAYAESIPYVYPRVSEEDVADPMDHIIIA